MSIYSNLSGLYDSTNFDRESYDGDQTTDYSNFICRPSISLKGDSCVSIEGNLNSLYQTDHYLGSLFFGCNVISSVQKIPNDIKYATALFKNCTNLKVAPSLPKSLTNCIRMFQGCTSLKDTPKLHDNLEDCRFMFADCTALTGINGNLPKSIKKYSHMFSGCSGLVIPPVIANPDTRSSMLDYTFSECKKLSAMPAIPANISQLPHAFENCTSIKDARIPSSVTNLSFTFNGCSSLTGINSDFRITPDKNSNYLFSKCRSLSSVHSGIIDPRVTSLYTTFSDCNLSALPVLPSGLLTGQSTFNAWGIQNENKIRICTFDANGNVMQDTLPPTLKYGYAMFRRI